MMRMRRKTFSPGPQGGRPFSLPGSAIPTLPAHCATKRPRGIGSGAKGKTPRPAGFEGNLVGRGVLGCALSA